MPKRTELEDELLWRLRAANVALPDEREYRAIPERRFKWDFAYVSHRLLIEVQGAVWVKGGHSTGTGINRDCEKLALATINHWYTIAVTKDQIRSGDAVAWIESFLNGS